MKKRDEVENVLLRWRTALYDYYLAHRLITLFKRLEDADGRE